MNKKLLFSFLLLSIILLSACKGGNNKVPATGFIGGKEGVVSKVNIESSSGANTVLDGDHETFNINVNLENKGEYTVEKGEVMVTLDGINYQAFQIQDPTKFNEIPLDKLRKENNKLTTPVQTVVQFDARYKPDEDADRSVDLAANVCYKYETITRVKDLCLRKKVTGISSTACKVDETKLSENSASPLVVTTFTQRPAGENKVTLFLEATNQGKGVFYKKNYLSKGKCVEDDKEKNKIDVKVELTEFPDTSSSLIKCSSLDGNEGVLNIIQNKVSLSCTIDTSSMQDSAFETPLRIIFDYVYKDGVNAQLKIKNVVG